MQLAAQFGVQGIGCIIVFLSDQQGLVQFVMLTIVKDVSHHGTGHALTAVLRLHEAVI